MFRGLSLQLRRAFTGERTAADPLTSEKKWIAELDKATFIAAGAESRAYAPAHYRDSAVQIRKDLTAARIHLEQAIQAVEQVSETVTSAREELHLAFLTLARIQAALGDFDEAERIYCSLLLSSDIPLIPNADKRPSAIVLGERQIKSTLELLVFLSRTGRNIKLAESLGAGLSKQPSGSLTYKEHCLHQLALIRLHVYRGEREDARMRMDLLTANQAVQSKAEFAVAVSLLRAINGTGNGKETEQAFLHVLVKSAALFGMWHDSTLKALCSYGMSLKSRGLHDYASLILSECYLGRLYRFGDLHPETRLVHAELEPVETPDHQSIFIDTKSMLEEESRLSVAYEHMCLDTVFDHLSMTEENYFVELERLLISLLIEDMFVDLRTAELRPTFFLRAQRMLARCLFHQGKLEEAIALVTKLIHSGDYEGDSAMLALDLVTLYATDTNRKLAATSLSRKILFDVDGRLNREQAQAFHRKLWKLDLMHFPSEVIMDDPLPLQTLQTVGTGAYAFVESITIEGRFENRRYARKSITLPRYNQNRVRQMIRNEISVMRTLIHPHIVQIYFTYEEKLRFAIMLEPLADCDLEVYLAQHCRSELLDTLQAEDCIQEWDRNWKLVWKWLYCLANTLSFIHSKGIRHKDIKTRNILVHGSEVIFADFGSSYAFADEGSSTTEGPAYGHTVMYSAPEVISWDKRTRSADIFSLGCVFTEMLTFLRHSNMSKYYEFRCRKTSGSPVGETHVYYATLDLVDTWFEGESFYTDVIKPMLSTDPTTRPTASTISTNIKAYWTERGSPDIIPKCQRCSPVI
jgi:serine/threonine protein kinase/tetratricopeptide (TPR) repeat protein